MCVNITIIPPSQIHFSGLSTYEHRVSIDELDGKDCAVYE